MTDVIENELVVVIDVDGTLIRPSEYGNLKLAYGSRICSFEPIQEHVDLLKSYKERGFYVIVWSMNGFRWARQVVQALKLDRFTDQIMSKPSKHVDDKREVDAIVGTRVFIAQEE